MRNGGRDQQLAHAYDRAGPGTSQPWQAVREQINAYRRQLGRFDDAGHRAASLNHSAIVFRQMPSGHCCPDLPLDESQGEGRKVPDAAVSGGNERPT